MTNEGTMFSKLDAVDPELGRIRRLFATTPEDIRDCLYEVWENLLLGRQWAESQTLPDQQQMAATITLRVTRKTINLDKNFQIVHPKSIYHRVTVIDNSSSSVLESAPKT